MDKKVWVAKVALDNWPGEHQENTTSSPAESYREDRASIDPPNRHPLGRVNNNEQPASSE